MNEVRAKEKINIDSLMSNNPDSNNEISGWIEDYIKPHFSITTRTKAEVKKTKNARIIKKHSANARNPRHNCRKPSLFEFFAANTTQITRTCKKPSPKINAFNRPLSVKTKPKNTKNEYGRLMLNTSVVLDRQCPYNRNFSPVKTKCAEYFRRSRSSFDKGKVLDKGLFIHGSSCDLKV